MLNLDFNAGARSGALPYEQLMELQKALEAGYGSDVAALTGGGALRIQSLEATLLATIQENRHFRLFNKIQKTNATATVDEWTEQRGVGGFLGGSTNTETGVIRSAQGDYLRQVGLVKYLMTRREVSFVTTLQHAITEAEAVEYQAGALQLLTDAEFLSFEGDASVVPTEFDGLYAQVRDRAGADHIIDMAGEPLESIVPINEASARIAGYGNFGIPTDIFLSQLTQSDLDSGLDPAFRVALDNSPNSIVLGTPVRAMKTSWGDIANNPDIFVRDENLMAPFEVLYPDVATANVAFKPAGLTAAAEAQTGSRWLSTHAGNYYYAVAGVNANGQSAVTKSAQVAVGAGEKVTLTITKSGADTETGYILYRSRKNGTNATDDFREFKRVPKAGATTVIVDINEDYPGSTKAYILNMVPGQKAITWRQFLPMLKFPLYPTNTAVVPWAQLLFGYLRLGKSKQHAIMKNIVPTGAKWKPFAA
jgi:hypothetical protein